MKKTLIYISSFISIVGLSGCDDDFDKESGFSPSLSAHYLRPSETVFESPTAAAFTRDFTIESVETAWMFSDVADWISLSPASGSSSSAVRLSVEENRDADNGRTSIFYLQSADPGWNFARAMSVSQAKAEATVRPETNSLSFGGTAGEQRVRIEANCEWTAECREEWVGLSQDAGSGILTVAVSENPGAAYRSATVSVSYGDGKTVAIEITQSPANITSSVYTLEYENAASKYDVVIESETEWHSTVSDSWISVSPSSGNAGRTQVAIEVAPNTSVASRSGYVTLLTGSAERIQIAIVQKGIYIEATESLSFSSAAESQTLSVRSNTSWAVASKPSWISMSKESGEGDSDITVGTTENPNTVSRTGEIVFRQEGLSIECRVRVVQSGKMLSAEVGVLEFSARAGVQTFSLVSDASWRSSKTADWFSMTPVTGQGNATVSVSAEENQSTDERSGRIDYLYGDKTVCVNVHQLGQYLTIEDGAFEFGSRGGSHRIELSTSEDWTAETEELVSWLKLSDLSGSGSGVITMTAEENPTVSDRTATVVIKAKYAQSVRIVVKQKARYLSVSSQSVQFFSEGGTSETVSIDTDGAYEIRSDATWFTVNKGAGDTFTVTASANATSEVRSGKITIALTDLTTGSLSLELTVMQAGKGGSFIIGGFPDDSDWSVNGNGTVTITITGYTSDKNWNSYSRGGLNVRRRSGEQ